jgi:sugar lactone lactonase YvrE
MFISGALYYTDGEVCLMAKGGQPESLVHCEGFTGLAWGPGGKEVWFSTFDGNGTRIQAVNLKGQIRLLTHYPGRLDLLDVDESGRCIAIAHHQQRQAFGRAPGAGREIDLTWLDSQKPLAIRDDGSQVLLTRADQWGMASRMGLYLRPLTGGPAVRLGLGSVDADLSQDGRWVATLEADGKGHPGLRLIPVGVGASRWYPLEGVALNADAVWFHPSGTFVYLAAEDTNRVSRMDLATGTLSPLPVPLGFSAYQKPFSPDGTKTLLQDMRASRPDDLLFPYLLFQGEGSPPVPAKGTRNPEVAAGWTDNNQEVYLYNRNVIPVPVYRWNPLTGARRPFLQISPADPSGVWGIYDLMLTPNGRAYTYSVVRKLSDLYLIEGLK